MAQKDIRQPTQEKPQRLTRRDVPGCIKYILLLLLILLLIGEITAGEFSKIGERGWIIWVILLIKLILIAGLIILIRVQRNLICKLTEPIGCTEEEPDPLTGKLIVSVKGTASGGVFSHYTLEVRKGAITYPGIVSYPGGGAGGIAPVINGELGQINTTSLNDGAYEVILSVYPTGPGSSKTCTATFNLLKALVYINRVANVPVISTMPALGNANPFDPTAELRLDLPPAYPFRSLGGLMTIAGAAYIYECAGRKIKKYEIRYAQVAAPGGEPTQPIKGDPIPATWPVADRVVLLEYPAPDYYQPWTRVGMAPMNLINSWKTMTIGGTTYFKLNPGTWVSGAAGSGRFSLLLTAEDTTGVTFHDIQHVWIDNKEIWPTVKIVKFQWKNPQTSLWEDIPPCEDLSLKKHGKIRIMGLAWDPLIDEAWWPPVAPNDNFSHYRLDFWKQFGPSHELKGNTFARVPSLPPVAPVPTPTDADADELAVWDLAILDAGPLPSPYVPPPDPKIYRGESCTYSVQLFATDTTVVNESTTHYRYYEVPVKIVNDL